jgi:signal transduction histidine kinase
VATPPLERVLVLDDDPDDFDLIQDCLRRGRQPFQAQWAKDPDQALEQAHSGAYSACLVDWRLGASSGVDFIRRVRSRGLDLPCILLTGRGDYAVDMEAMREGAADYLTKDGLQPENLERAVRYAASRAGLARELVKQERLAVLGRMAAGLAHELRNPLMVIQLYASELARTQGEGAAGAGHLKMIQDQADRVLGLMNDILQLGRKPQAKAAPVQAAALMRDSLNLARAQYGSRHKGVAVTLEGPEGLAFPADRQQLEQVMINLIVNSFQAMDGRGRLVLGWEQVNGGVALWVDDSGPGLEPEQLLRLFEPFHTTKEQGTGLGLWLCQTMIQSLGGVLRAFSRPGSGTSLVAWIPEPAA